MFKSLDSLSNFIRAVVSLVLLGVLGVGGWLGYSTYYQKDRALEEAARQLARREEDLAKTRQELARLGEELKAARQEIERLATAVRLLKVDHRVAQIVVLDQAQTPGEPDSLETTFTFVEVDDGGKPLDKPRKFTIRGDILYVDGWVVKFRDDFVERGDPLRGSSLFLFRRLFGQHQEPSKGFDLDPIGTRPAAYGRGTPMSDFEREIWANFWDYATDEKKAAAAGIRSASGDAKSTRLIKGKLYKILLRASDGTTISPAEDAPPAALETTL